MALHLLDLDLLRSECRKRLESCELWLRRIIDDQLSADLGSGYFAAGTFQGQSIFRNDIRSHAATRQAKEPGRFRRPIDALLLDHLATVLCKHGVYQKYFAEPFRHSFASAEHLRVALTRLVPVRNALSHANPISLHDAERVLCYCDDIIATLVQYYEEKGMAKDFNAPTFTRFSDSLRHSEVIQRTRDSRDFSASSTLHAGDSLRLELEVDAHYDPSDYTIQWNVANISAGESGQGHSFAITLQPKHVGEQFVVAAMLRSRKDWHRHSNFDASFTVSYRVLPLE